ncbi:MAG TPA: PP2C family protein-serine/threonine phosphatase [Planctomycetota bacterium]|nr:PP2C family protein-serine/threonine phosphatase [Planctomycetota bacterium]
MGKAGRMDAKTWAVLQAIQHRLARDPGWQVLAHERHWLCPYCGEVGVTPYQPSRAASDVLRHFAHECRHWSEGAGTRFGRAALEAKARQLELEESLRTDPAWRLTDWLNRWWCPYCAEATTVLWHAEAKAVPPPLERVLEHLERCAAHGDKRKPFTAEALDLIVREASRHGELTAKLRRRIESEPAWRQAAPDGTWVCPECRRPVPEVNISTDLLLTSTAPGHMAQHLLERCTPGQPEAPAAGRTPTEAEPPQRDLERAREIVQKMLPAESPRVEGYDFYCLYRPAERIGGDFYDYFRLSDHEVAFLIGDVSGHGLEAALIMAMVKKSLKLHAQHHRSPAEVLRRTNLDINADLDARTFVSACYAVLDARGGSLTFARAGHNLPVLFNPRRTPPIRHLESKGMVMGVYRGGLFDQVTEELEIGIRPGDVFVLYTDGLVEARGPGGEPFGLGRLEAAIARTHGDLASPTLAGQLFEDVRAFAGEALGDDDIAILCLRALGQPV